jgi:hypothetical protein
MHRTLQKMNSMNPAASVTVRIISQLLTIPATNGFPIFQFHAVVSEALYPSSGGFMTGRRALLWGVGPGMSVTMRVMLVHSSVELSTSSDVVPIDVLMVICSSHSTRMEGQSSRCILMALQGMLVFLKLRDSVPCSFRHVMESK